MRDQMLTQLRFISHVLIGLAIGVLYNDIGNNAYYTQQNVSMIFLVTLFLVSYFESSKINIFLAFFCADAHCSYISDGNASICQRAHELLVLTQIVLHGQNCCRHALPGKTKFNPCGLNDIFFVHINFAENG